MARLKAAFIAVAVLWAVPGAADPVDRWSAYIGEASARFGVPEAWIRRVMGAESGGRTLLNGRPIVSRAGAMGLMQLMPSTWQEMRALLGLGANPYDPRDNILAGAAYLRAMYDRFGYPGLFAAYNAGPARYSAWLTAGRRLPSETIAYVANVAGGDPVVSATPRRMPQPALFAVRAAASQPGTAFAAAAGDGLFVRLDGQPR